MISRSASRRIRRERTGGQKAFRRRQATLRDRNKLEREFDELARIKDLLDDGIKMERNQATNRFVSLRVARFDASARIKQLWRRAFGGSAPESVTA
jgi:hypothetical protein